MTDYKTDGLTIPTPEELHDWRRDCHGIDRRPSRDLWIAGLVGAWAGGLSLLCALWLSESVSNAGRLNGCETLAPAECAAFAAEDR